MSACFTSVQAGLAPKISTIRRSAGARLTVVPVLARSAGGRGAGSSFNPKMPGKPVGQSYSPGGIIIPGGGQQPGAPGAPGQQQNFSAPGGADFGQKFQPPQTGNPTPGSIQIPRTAPAAPEAGEEFYQPWRNQYTNLDGPNQNVKKFADMNEDELLTYVQRRGGAWHEMAKAIQRLWALGVTSELIHEITSLSPREQNLWNVASNVFYSVIADDLPKESMDYFNFHGQNALYELRVLDGKERMRCAIFAAEKQMDSQEAYDFAKAVKDYSKRKFAAQQEGFTSESGDMFALKYYREAMEQRGQFRDHLANKGLAVASSSSAKMTLERLLALEEAADYDPAKNFSKLPVVALEEQEQAFFPLPVLGNLNDLTMSLFQNVPQSFTEGPFSVFKAGGGVKWTAVPLFGPINSSDDPVAIIVPDTRALDAISNLNQRAGEVMLIIDREKRKPEADEFFVVFQKSSLVIGAGTSMERPSILAGRDIAGQTDMKVAGKVILAIRPSDMMGDGIGYGSGDAVAQLD